MVSIVPRVRQPAFAPLVLCTEKHATLCLYPFFFSPLICQLFIDICLLASMQLSLPANLKENFIPPSPNDYFFLSTN